MSITYVSIMVPINEPQPSAMYQLADPNSKDYSRSAVDKLNATGLKWEHNYYWPGDDYYAIVKINSDVDKNLTSLRQIGDVMIVDERYRTASGATVGDLFSEKIN